MPESGAELHTRLNKAAAGRSYRHISDLTGIHPETVRRYMQGQAPSAEFLSRFCETLELNADWLLLGRGSMRAAIIPSSNAAKDSTSDPVHSIAASLERVTQRLDRLESTIHQLESRLRGARAFMLTGDDQQQTSHAQSVIEAKPAPSGSGSASAAIDQRPEQIEIGKDS
jgi:transcriptional regulator with XRE-family HTH domain